MDGLKRELEAIVCAVGLIGPGKEADPCLLTEYEEQLSGLKAELTSMSRYLLLLDDDDSTLAELQEWLRLDLFDARLKVKCLLSEHAGSPTFMAGTSSVKLPKLSVPTFDGNVVGWRSFWEQYTVSVHDRTDLSPSQKLTYLK